VRFSQAAWESIEQAALYALYVVLITLLVRLQSVLGYVAPSPLDQWLRWVPGIALLCLAFEVVVQVLIRIAFDAWDRISLRLRVHRSHR